MEGGMPWGLEDIASGFQNYIAERKMMKEPILESRRGVITDFRIPRKLRIGNTYEVSAVYRGSVKSGYFTLIIQDADGSKQRFNDCNSVVDKLLYSGKSVQTGTLNFLNGIHESKWEFTPYRPLYYGYAKATVCMFEDTTYYPLAVQEKEIQLI